MALYKVTRGTTLRGKTLDEGKVVELADHELATIREFVIPAPEPEPAKDEKPKK